MKTMEEYLEWFERRVDIRDIDNFKMYLKLKGYKRIMKTYYVLKPYLKHINDKDIADVYKYDRFYYERTDQEYRCPTHPLVNQ